MSDNNATVTTQEGTAEQQEKTFTQAELDSIVKDRLAREKGMACVESGYGTARSAKYIILS